MKHVRKLQTTLQAAPWDALKKARWWAALQAGVYVDRSMSGPYSNATTQGGAIPLPPAGLQASTATLRLFVDRSLLEVRDRPLPTAPECLWQS